jgi:hypothetical protein
MANSAGPMWMGLEADLMYYSPFSSAPPLSSRMEEPIVAYSQTLLLAVSTRQVVRGLLACAVMVGLGILLMEDSDWNLIGCAAVGFFGIHALLWAVLLLPGTHLELSSERITLRTWFRTFSYLWQDLEPFRIYRIGPVKIICFNLSSSVLKLSPYQFLHRASTGFDSSIPDIFELAPSVLVCVLEDWRCCAMSPSSDETVTQYYAGT